MKNKKKGKNASCRFKDIHGVKEESKNNNKKKSNNL